MANEALLANSHVYDPDSDSWVNENFQRVAEIINDLDPTLRLLWIPPAQRLATDIEPYAVAQMRWGFEPYIIFYVKEEELDARVIAKLFDSRSDDLNAKIDHMEAARKLMEAKQNEERLAEIGDRAYSMWHSPKHYYELGKGQRLHL
jgi:hypothetical protein